MRAIFFVEGGDESLFLPLQAHPPSVQVACGWSAACSAHNLPPRRQAPPAPDRKPCLAAHRVAACLVRRSTYSFRPSRCARWLTAFWRHRVASSRYRLLAPLSHRKAFASQPPLIHAFPGCALKPPPPSPSKTDIPCAAKQRALTGGAAGTSDGDGSRLSRRLLTGVPSPALPASICPGTGKPPMASLTAFCSSCNFTTPAASTLLISSFVTGSTFKSAPSASKILVSNQVIVPDVWVSCNCSSPHSH